MAHFPKRWAFSMLFLVGASAVGCSSSSSESGPRANENDKGSDASGPSSTGTTGGSSTFAGTSGSGGSSAFAGTSGSSTASGSGTGVTIPGGSGFGAGGSGFGVGTTGGSGGASSGEGTIGAGGSSAPGGVGAGEWDDNANYREFMAYLKTSAGYGFSPLDVSQRQFVVVKDSNGRPVANCPVVISDATQHQTTVRTLSSGRAPLFPRAVGLVGDTLSVQATCAEGSAQGTLSAATEDNVAVLSLTAPRATFDIKPIELAFILDTTGSMSEEIEAIKDTISAVATKLTPQQALSLRVALVAYRDYGDVYVTKTFPFTTDLASLRTSIASLSAGGGGDIPEAVNEAMHAANQLDWHDTALARMAFLVADAPPHMNEQYDYALEAKKFLSRGIQVFTVNASGQDDLGQIVFRQIAQYTYATNMFVLRGGAGPSSVGGGDPKTSCGNTQTSYATGNLDELIVQKVLAEVALNDKDPLDIPGLHTDRILVACPGDGGVKVNGEGGIDGGTGEGGSLLDVPAVLPDADGGASGD